MHPSGLVTPMSALYYGSFINISGSSYPLLLMREPEKRLELIGPFWLAHFKPPQASFRSIILRPLLLTIPASFPLYTDAQ